MSNNKKFEIEYKTHTTFWEKEKFIKQLKYVENNLIKKSFFIKLDKPIYSTSKLYHYNNVFWLDNLMYHIKKHNVKPSDEFIDFIMGLTFQEHQPIKKVIKIRGKLLKKHKKRYLKVNQNQILIMDSLLKSGSSKKYYDTHDKKFRYSEHSGLLDFDANKLEKIIVSSVPSRVDDNDEDIYLPENMVDAYDYEYFFHTHPATPKIGGRTDVGILYEFPSVSDIFHFIEHYNEGTTQGSIIIAPEGLYLIRKHHIDNKKIYIKNEIKAQKYMTNIMSDIQTSAIKKYGDKFTTQTFYSKIAQDMKYINLINKKIHKYGVHIEYIPRTKNKKGNWLIKSIYLPVFAIEKI